MVVLPCGAGKTVVGIGAMARVGRRTLVLTTNQTAVSQWKRELLEKTGGLWTMEEGCLSLPGIRGKVEREKLVVIEGQDLDGKPVRIEADGLNGRCLLHEYDHLEGTLFIDRLSPAKKQSIKRRLRELEEEFEEQQATV